MNTLQYKFGVKQLLKPKSYVSIQINQTLLLAHLESAYSLIWGSHKIWGKGGRDVLDLL